MRCISLAFQIWLAGKISAAGIGLFQLVMSVNLLAATVAISGIRFATTRLISEEVGLGRPGGVGRAMRRCFVYAVFFGTAALTILHLAAEPIGFLWIGDARTVLSLRLCALCMPALALTSVLAGYFTATGRVYKTAAVQIFEQLAQILLVMLFVRLSPAGDLEKSCASVVAGGLITDYLGLILVAVLYVFDRRRHREPGPASPRLTPRMLSIALPLALSSYARTSLSTFQQLLVPRGLRLSGLSADAALSGYGIILGMVFPIITFPSCLLSALAELLVPELTQAQVAGRRLYIRGAVLSLMKRCLLFSLVIAAGLYLAADALGVLIYGSAEAGHYIRIFSPLVPVIYMDIVIDGCLKGLGQMMQSMVYNITEAAIGVTLVWFLLPNCALDGYIFIIFICELLNFTLSMRRLCLVALKGFDRRPDR